MPSRLLDLGLLNTHAVSQVASSNTCKMLHNSNSAWYNFGMLYALLLRCVLMRRRRAYNTPKGRITEIGKKVLSAKHHFSGDNAGNGIGYQSRAGTINR